MWGTVSFLARRKMEFDLTNWESISGRAPTYRDLLRYAMEHFELPIDRENIFQLTDDKFGPRVLDVLVPESRFSNATHLRLEYVERHWDRLQAEIAKEVRTPRYLRAMQYLADRAGITVEEFRERIKSTRLSAEEMNEIDREIADIDS